MADISSVAAVNKDSAIAVRKNDTGRRYMTHHSGGKRTTHPVAEMYAREYKAGQMSRREFLVRSTALGVSAVAAYSMIGLKPAMAQRVTPPAGGNLRIQMQILALMLMPILSC